MSLATQAGIVESPPRFRMTSPPPSVRPLLHFAIALIAVSAAFAQSTNPPSPGPPSKDRKDDDTVALSPFVVAMDQDTGYIAADTLNAGRLRTNLLMTPGTMEVFTRDLLDDLGVFNIDEASAWLTSSHPLETG